MFLTQLGGGDAFPPQMADLVYLHKLIRENRSFTVMEFGVGYSSIIIADALKKNKKDWDNLSSKPEIRNRYMFQLFSVDASQLWIKKTKSIFPKELLKFVNFQFSEVIVGKFNGRICHYYSNLPDIVPDFVYLDGPAPRDVQGSINGLTFRCDERTVMAADCLLMESVMLPGTVIVVDGRTNNARFLKNNFQRNWSHIHEVERDITIFKLDETRLGKHNLCGCDFFI